MKMSLYKLNKLIQGYPILVEMIDSVQIVQQGQGEKSTIVEVKLKNFLTKNEN